MQKETNSARNIVFMFMLMILCAMVMTGAMTSGHDTWLAFVGILVLYLPIVLIYSRTLSLFPGKNFLEVIQLVFGGVAAKVVIFLLAVFMVPVSALVLRNFVEFSVVISLGNTPRIVIMIGLGAVALFLASKGMELVGRWSIVASILIISNVVFFLFISSDIMHINNILPIMDLPLGTLFQNTFMIGSIAVGDCLLILACVTNIKKGESIYKAYIGGFVLGILMTTGIIMRNQFILAGPMAGIAKFASFLAVRIVRKGNFLERIESLVTFNLFVMGITKIAITLAAASRATAVLVKEKNDKHMLAPILMLALMVCSFTFKNMQDMFNFAWGYRFLAMPFQFGAPILVWIKAEIYTRKVAALPPATAEMELS